ncbi:50S ribosomal protein L22 [Candidatus Parcubacteria bacterium]|jgi:large subunit ribosomal protein L22|nr:50S ribosomal protein L22 [Candidatus Parcubacteria bacterium]MBT3949221.1 50S ribosomal protein L22 [Candidatus Parcubacteria bacterium]
MKAQATAHLKFLRMSPQKVRLIAGLVRGLKVEDALVQLTFSKKRAASPVKKLIESAIANAQHNHDLKKDTLVIETIFVNEGSTLRRWMPRAMGRATPLRKRSSHITLVLEGEVDEKAKKSKETKKEDKKENKKDVKVEKEEKEVKKETKKEASASAKATADKDKK